VAAVRGDEPTLLRTLAGARGTIDTLSYQLEGHKTLGGGMRCRHDSTHNSHMSSKASASRLTSPRRTWMKYDRLIRLKRIYNF
jgi:hypothetical protein